jgi:hypothetical protein
MKLFTHAVLAVFATTAVIRADVEVTMPELQSIGFLPQDKADLRPEEKLNLKRRNPFAERKKVVAAKPTEKIETEESKLRTFFDKQQISGLFKNGGKFTVALGRLVLEPGQTIPQIIPDQTQILRVIRVDESTLEIGWVEDGNYDQAVPRKIVKKIDLKPKVRQYIVSEDSTRENPQTFLTDEKGKVILPSRSIVPNPSAIVENLPPGSDTNPDSALSAVEHEELTAPAVPQPPPPGQETGPDSLPPVAPPPAASAEDAVQPDPDVAPPRAEEGKTPAGPPKK